MTHKNFMLDQANNIIMRLLDIIELSDPDIYFSSDEVLKADKWIQLYNRETRENDQTKKQLKNDIKNL